MARRSQSELIELYDECTKLFDTMNNNQISVKLNIGTTVVANWRKGNKPKVAFKPGTRDDNDKVVIEHTIINNIPIKDEIYLLLVQGDSIESIALQLDQTIETIAHMKAYYIRQNLINPNQSNANLNFKEIALILDIHPKTVRQLYLSGLAKLFTLLEDSELDIDIIEECFRDTGATSSVRTRSAMMN